MKGALAIVRQDPYVCERTFTYGHRGTAPQGIRGKGVGLAIVRAIVERAGGMRFVLAFSAVGAESEGRLS